MLCEAVNLYLRLVVVFDSHSHMFLKFCVFSFGELQGLRTNHNTVEIKFCSVLCIIINLKKTPIILCTAWYKTEGKSAGTFFAMRIKKK